jgi:hypothetical protein
MASNDDQRASQPLQFGLKTLLVLVFGAAFSIAMVVSVPSAVAVPMLMCLALAIPGVLTAVLVYGGPYQRVFCMAAIFPTGAVCFATLWLITVSLFDTPGGNLEAPSDWLDFFDAIDMPYRVYSAGAWVLGCFTGCAAMWIRKCLTTPQQR